MQEHLEHCEECEAARDAWQLLFDVVATDAAFEPPEAAVRLARAMFPVERPRGRLARIAEAARLLFDSRLEPLAAGVRSGESAARKLLYDAGDGFVVDLRVQPSDVSKNKMMLVGQVTNLQRPITEAAGARAQCFSARQLSSATTTNQFGEFTLEFDAGDEGLVLAIALDAKAIVIPLGVLLFGEQP